MLLAIELTLRYQMCDLHLKFDEDRTKTVVAIESNIGTSDRRTNEQTDCREFMFVLNCRLPGHGKRTRRTSAR